MGDILLAINGRAVDGRFPEQLPPIQNFIASQPVGAPLALSYKRGAATLTATVITEQLESRVGEEWVFDAWGLAVRKVSRAFARQSQLPDDTGVLVIGSSPASPPTSPACRGGDLITKVNQKPVGSLDFLKGAHQAYLAKPEPTLFRGPARPPGLAVPAQTLRAGSAPFFFLLCTASCGS